ncbi:MAG: hypothetical protein FJW23_09750 [Acidimicrobiia bacterium]|nr:hypothetical protein [Acidimicrobiia bacterium]
MTLRTRFVLTGAVCMLIGAVLSTALVRGQAAAKIDGKFTHISLAVRDVDKTAAAVAALFGLPAPQSRIFKDIPFPPSYGNKTMVGKVASVNANGIRIEIIQPMTDSPWKDFIDEHGEGVHHVGWDVSNYADAVKFLESKGGKWVQGNVAVNFGYVDMYPAGVPFAIEVIGAGGAKLPPQDR